jgi:hypothetical protein
MMMLGYSVLFFIPKEEERKEGRKEQQHTMKM